MIVGTISNSMRLPFLALTPACVFLGAGSVIPGQSDIDIHLLLLALLGALLAHISVNTLNEYADFKSGLDLKTTRTPFSGGSGALPKHPELAAHVLVVGIACLIGTSLIGIFFAWKHGAGIVPLGVAGLVLVVGYTQWITRRPFLCLIAPGLGFGFLMVAGTHFALTGEYLAFTWLVGVVPFLLINNLLLLNQYPDLHADREAGRNNLLIAYGTRTGAAIYGAFVILAIAAVILFVASGLLPALSLVVLLPMPLALLAFRGALRHAEDIGDHPHYLGANAAVAVLTPALLGASIMLG